MKITVHSSRIVKPAYGGGAAPAPGVVPLTVFDKATFEEYAALILAFRAPAPPNATLEIGLAKALAEYREYAGRLGTDASGDGVILLNDAGVRFVEATADVALDSVLPLKPTRETLGLHPSGDGAEELWLVQITRFSCGSLVMGTISHHVVGDGLGVTNFLIAWSQATRGAAIDPVPVHDRTSFFKPRDPPLVEFNHRGVEFEHRAGVRKVHRNNVDGEIVEHRVHFTREFISMLKSQASAGAPREYNTFHCVTAHLWRCITKARRLDGGVSTAMRIAVDGRKRMRPPVPDGYTGNLVLWAWPTTTAGDLVARPLQHAAELIRREVARIDGRYFRSFVDFASSGEVEKERMVPTADATDMVLSPNLELNSLLRIPYHDMNFGGGRPVSGMPGYLPAEGTLYLMQSFSFDGSIDAYVPLFNRDMDAFMSCCYSLASMADARL